MVGVQGSRPVRIVEMSLGVSISCMPAFSRMLRHALPAFEELRSRITNFGPSSRSRSKGSNESSYNNEGKPDTLMGADNFKESLSDHELGFVQPSNTYIYYGGGSGYADDGDGIHLRYDLRQVTCPSGEEFGNPDAKKEQRAPGTEVLQRSQEA
ncbi:MAG: hypothetical protein Q9187_005915 [Circinaria calcarea]